VHLEQVGSYLSEESVRLSKDSAVFHSESAMQIDRILSNQFSVLISAA
jgi:hypothetical protein